MPHPSPPEGASPYSGTGPLATRADWVLADLHERLREHYDESWEIDRYTLPASDAWSAVVAHYDATLGDRWKRDSRYAADAGAGYMSRVWTAGDHAIAIALIRARLPDQHDVLLVLLPKHD